MNTLVSRQYIWTFSDGMAHTLEPYDCGSVRPCMQKCLLADDQATVPIPLMNWIVDIA